MKILILTLSLFDKGVYSNFFETQEKTWNSLDVEGVETYFYFGGSDKNYIENNIVKTNVRESLFNCGYKTLTCFELIKNKDFDFIFRTNSSSYVDKSLLKNFLSDKPKEKFYCGLNGDHHGIKFASGCGFFLSRDLLDLILTHKSAWNHSLIDDVALAEFLKNFKIYPENAPRFDFVDNEKLIDSNTPLDYYHYRFKNRDRFKDCEMMMQLHNLKLKL